jgi:hypothetical protein
MSFFFPKLNNLLSPELGTTVKDIQEIVKKINESDVDKLIQGIIKINDLNDLFKEYIGLKENSKNKKQGLTNDNIRSISNSLMEYFGDMPNSKESQNNNNNNNNNNKNIQSKSIEIQEENNNSKKHPNHKGGGLEKFLSLEQIKTVTMVQGIVNKIKKEDIDTILKSIKGIPGFCLNLEKINMKIKKEQNQNQNQNQKIEVMNPEDISNKMIQYMESERLKLIKQQPVSLTGGKKKVSKNSKQKKNKIEFIDANTSSLKKNHIKMNVQSKK